MAPSPEQGQPKAPDKSSSNATSAKQNANEISQQQQQQKSATAVETVEPIANCGNNMTSTAGASGGGNSSSNSCSGAPQEVSSKNLKRMNDADFKVLLDEAFSYKSPKDREKKSETFRRLLDNVERNKDHQFPELSESRYQRGTNNQHGGSLQDLKESGANDILDTYTYGKNNRRQHHNSRTLKYSLVSTRQREGGSLPSNVNVYNCFLTNEPKFLNEVGTKRRGKAERTFSGASSNSGQDSIVSYESKDDSVLGDHTTITEIDISEDGSQGQANTTDIDVGVEVFATMNLKTTLEISCPESKSGSVGGGGGHWVDDTVSFSSLERSKANVDATTCALPFDDSSKSCQSVLGEKPEKPKTAIFQSSKVITPQVDENGNAIVAKKKKKFDADRNTTTVDLTEVKGYRGHDPIETLVKFIENSENSDSTKKNDKLPAVAGGKKREKKKEKDPKKDMHKMKKSTSLEELRSCTKLDEDDKSASGVIMRTKGKKTSGGNLATSPTDGKENIKQNTKRGERRSWGTEELTYLGENNAIEEVREKNKEREKAAKKVVDRQAPLERCEKPDKVDRLPKKKKGERSLSVISMESAHSETAEFHVVTKKKRSKKRQSFDDARTTSGKVPATFNLKPTHPGHKKYQSSNSFSNDRDSYLNTYSPNESRRKSTSSVPPSEKSDSSDLDSVHSLPIESVSGRHQSGGGGGNGSQMQHQSYADIARTVNASKNAALWQANNVNQKDKWPVVSASTTSNTSTATNEIVAELCSNPIQVSSAAKQRSSSAKTKSLAKDFPDLATDRNGKTSSSYDGASTCSSSSSTSTIVKQISYSQSLGDENIIVDFPVAKVAATKSPVPVPAPAPVPIAAPTTKLTDVVRGNENTKQTLQKSKSADNERFYSVEQYPALEKTVKRHSTQNPINDIKPLPNPTNGSGLVLAAAQPPVAGKQRLSSTSSTYSQTQQQQQQQSISTPLTYGSSNVSPNTIPSTGSTGAVPVAASNDSIATATTANSALSDTSKIVINNNLDMNTKIAATSSSSSNSLGNITNSSTNSSIIVTNNGKKSKANTKASSESSAPSSLVEVNNAKNSSTPSQTPSGYGGTVPTEDGVVLMNHTSASNANPKKSTKTDSQESLQQTVSNSGNPTFVRKSKKEKHYPGAGTTDDISSGQTTLPSSQGKHSNRPAVIILNEASDSTSYGGGDFTFGDFNEEELRLFECNNHLDDSVDYNATAGPDVNSCSSIVSDHVHEDVHLSPHSDLGYSSSNNRSILSESMDQNNISSSTGAGPPKMGTSACPASELNSNTTTITSHLSTTHEHNDYKMLLPNDSAIIIASKNPSISSHFASSALLQSHANMVPTNLVGAKLFNTSSSSANQKVLSNSIAFSANHNKYTDIKPIELTEHDLNVTNNSSHNSEIVNNSNIKNDSNSSTEILGIRSVVSPNNNGSVEREAAATTTLDQYTRSNYPRRSSATSGGTTTSMNQTSRGYNASASAAVPQKSSCDNNTMMKRLRKEVNIRFIAPPITHDINSANYEKLVDFVGLAWEDIMHGVNGETEYYDGQ